MIRRDHVVALVVRNTALEFGKCFRKNPAATVLVEPAQLGLRTEKNSAQDERVDTFRVGFRIGERQRRSPRAAEKLTTLDAELLAYALDVLDQILRRVVFNGCVRS